MLEMSVDAEGRKEGILNSEFRSFSIIAFSHTWIFKAFQGKIEDQTKFQREFNINQGFRTGRSTRVEQSEFEMLLFVETQYTRGNRRFFKLEKGVLQRPYR